MKLSRDAYLYLLGCTKKFLDDYDLVRDPLEECAWNVLREWMIKALKKAVDQQKEYSVKLDKSQAAALQWAFGYGTADMRVFSIVNQLVNQPKKLK